MHGEPGSLGRRLQGPRGRSRLFRDRLGYFTYRFIESNKKCSGLENVYGSDLQLLVLPGAHCLRRLVQWSRVGLRSEIVLRQEGFFPFVPEHHLISVGIVGIIWILKMLNQISWFLIWRKYKICKDLWRLQVLYSWLPSTSHDFMLKDLIINNMT